MTLLTNPVTLTAGPVAGQSPSQRGISSCVTDVWTPHVRFDLDLAVDSLMSCWRQADAVKSFSGIILILNIQEIPENVQNFKNL